MQSFTREDLSSIPSPSFRNDESISSIKINENSVYEKLCALKVNKGLQVLMDSIPMSLNHVQVPSVLHSQYSTNNLYLVLNSLMNGSRLILFQHSKKVVKIKQPTTDSNFHCCEGIGIHNTVGSYHLLY